MPGKLVNWPNTCKSSRCVLEISLNINIFVYFLRQIYTVLHWLLLFYCFCLYTDITIVMFNWSTPYLRLYIYISVVISWSPIHSCFPVPLIKNILNLPFASRTIAGNEGCITYWGNYYTVYRDTFSQMYVSNNLLVSFF